MASEPAGIAVLCRDGAKSALVAPWLGVAPAPVEVVTDFDEQWCPSSSVAVVVTPCHYEMRELLLLRRLMDEGRVGVLVLADGVLEYRNTWQHPKMPPGALFQPVHGHKIACLGRSQARALESWGNLGRCELVGLPRLDASIAARPRRREPLEPFRILVATANVPGFDTAQVDAARASLRDLRDWHAQNPRQGDVAIELVWRVSAGLDDQLGIPREARSPRAVPMGDALAGADAVVTTPSTVQVEGMLQGLPVAVLDYTNSPHFVPAAWTLTAAAHIEQALPELLDPPAGKRVFQNLVLHDTLECRSPAAERMQRLLEAMVACVVAARERGAHPEFAPRILADERFGHQPLSKSYDLAALFPEHGAFRETELERLRGEVARFRHATQTEPCLRGELRRSRAESAAWEARYRALASLPPLRALLWLRDRLRHRSRV